MKNIIIIDDILEHTKQMENIINGMTEKFTINSYSHPSDILNNINTIEPNSIFILDILLENMNGINLAHLILNKAPNACIIFISSYLEKATEVYDVPHCYFVYKPEMKKRLPLAIKKAIQSIDDANKKLIVNLKDKTQLISIDDINYFERNKRTTYIHCHNETIKTSIKINDFITQLPETFVRCHNSYIVNLNSVSEFCRENFILNNKNNSLIPISRAYRQDVKEKFHKFLMKKI